MRQGSLSPQRHGCAEGEALAGSLRVSLSY